MSRLHLVRHAENRANTLQVFSCRHVDYSLTARGIVQARQTGPYLQKRGVDRIYSSPLKRAVETAEIIADQVDLTVDVVESLTEVDVGRLEGQPIDEQSRAFYYAILEDWLAGETEATFPDGEGYASFYQRAERALERMISEESGDRVVVVGHSGFFKAASKLLCPGLDPHWVVESPYPNCAVSEIEAALREGRLVGHLLSWGCDGHLSGMAETRDD